jgi:hypothetical protein
MENKREYKDGVLLWTESQAKRAAKKIWNNMNEILKEPRKEIMWEDIEGYSTLAGALVSVLKGYVPEDTSALEWLESE